MNIPELKANIRLHEDRTTHPTRLLAFAELTIAGCFVIKGIRILQRTDKSNIPGDEAPFVVFPAERRVTAGSNRWYDLAHPTTTEAREAAVRVIMDAYDKAFNTCKCGSKKHGQESGGCDGKGGCGR